MPLEVLRQGIDFMPEYQGYPIVILEDKVMSNPTNFTNFTPPVHKDIDPRYPIGKFDMNFEVSPEMRDSRIQVISELPSRLRAAVDGLEDGELDTPYRGGGWTVRQVVHHVPDSHANAFIRFKLALTEDSPTIRPYEEDRWAKLGDAKMPVEVSLKLIEAIHERWVGLLNAMSYTDSQREFAHPKRGGCTLAGAF